MNEMISARIAALMLVGALSFGDAAFAQTVADSSKIELAVALAVRRTLPTGLVKFDSRIRREPNWDSERSAARLQELAKALGGRSAHQEDIIRCTNSPADCTIAAKAFVVMSVASITGSTATLIVCTSTPSGALGWPIYTQCDEYTLKFAGSAWKVTSVRRERVT